MLGLEESLVAISHECDTLNLSHTCLTRRAVTLQVSRRRDQHPRGADGQRRALYTVNAALIRELQPDLVVTQGICDVCAVTPDTIETSLRGSLTRSPRRGSSP